MSTINQTQSESRGELVSHLGEVRARRFGIGIVAALGWGLLATVGVIAIAAWCDLLWELPGSIRQAALILGLATGGVLLAWMITSLVRGLSWSQLATELDQVGDTGGEIISGLELSEHRSRTSRFKTQQDIEQGLASIAVDKAARAAKQIDKSRAAPIRPLKIAGIALGTVVLSLGVLGFSMPKLATTQWARFANPSDDTPPFTMMEFDIEPGDIEIKYGSPLEVICNLSSAPIDELKLLIQSDTEEIVPMFSESDTEYRATLFRVTKPFTYQVQSGRAKSDKFRVGLIRVPEIRDVQFRLTPPEYTRLGTRIVSAQDGIADLKGTRVQVIANSNMPLARGELVVSNDENELVVKLTPGAATTNEATGEFLLDFNGKFELRLFNEEGMESNQNVFGSITLVEDLKPFVRMLSPRQSSMATATAQLPVVIESEDDFGLSKLEIYRSLNDSRPLPKQFDFRKSSSRIREKFLLPLAEYDLRPGDVLEFFARVEDNHPGYNKGSESPVHSVQIISQQQFERMNQQQMGIEAVMAKYRQIARRLESLETMQREIEQMDADPQNPDQNQNKEVRDRLVNSAKEFKQSAKEMQKLLQRRFPIDFDEELSERIDKLSEKMFEISRKINELIREDEKGELENAELKQRLKELREELEGIREDFEQAVMEPLGQLAKAFQLMRKQQEFVQLVLRQRNLAERLQSLDEKDSPDEPGLKRRMRELSDEQAMLEKRLGDLVFEIENQAISLPAIPEFEQLRKTAMEFAQEIDESGAADEQIEAAKCLAEFSGSDGFSHATRAAKILESFLEQSEKMNQQAQQGLNQIFKPEFGRPKLGNSLQQLMDMFGPKNGAQQGNNNRGLYGDQPMQQQQEQRGGQGDERRRSGGMFAGSPSSEREGGNEINRDGGNAGSAQVTVPLQYERKVSEYYRRIVEELGDN